MSKGNFCNRLSYRGVASIAASSLLMLLGVGCGGGDAEPAVDPLTKPQFMKQANAICEKELREKDEAVQQAFSKAAKAGQPSQRALEGIVSRVVLPSFEKTTNELAELTPPAKEADTVEGILRKFKEVLKETEEDPGRMLTADPFIPASEAAKAYGLTACRF